MTALEEVIEKSVRLAKHTRDHYLGAVRDFIAFAGRDPSRWTGPTVEAWRDTMRSQGLKPQSVNAKLKALRYASKRLAQRGEGRDFAPYAEALKPSATKVVRPLSFEDARRILQGITGTRPIDLRDRAILVAAFRTGLRAHELRQLGAPSFREGPAPAATVTLKGGEEHTIALDTETLAALDPWVAWLRAQRVAGGLYFRSVKRQGVDGTTPVGASLSSAGLYLIMVGRAKDVGITDFHPHRTRHSLISWTRDRGGSYEYVRRGTGQRSTGTVDRYSKAAAPIAIGEWLPSLFDD